jgi:succinoglycan biosynthesis transport protein ExoP
VLNSAIPPSSPSGPKVFLNMVLSVFLGGIISISVALIAEMINRHIRSEEDITSILNIPVLGTLNHSVKKGSWLSRAFK